MTAGEWQAVPPGPVVLCAVRRSVEPIRAAFPGLTVVDISRGVPDGVRGDVLFGGLGAVSAEAMARGVRWVQMAGTGVDGAPPEVRGAPVLTASHGASAVPISEYVLAAMGAFVRGFPGHWLRQAPDRWNHQPATTLAGATLALFGFGGIAERIARIALAMEMDVVALRRREVADPAGGVRIVRNLPDLIGSADHLVLAAPATPQTHHVIDERTLGAAKPGLHLVNVARGSLVDHDALRVALDGGVVARASLDVTEPEPPPPGHWLYEHPKVYLTPHASWVGGPSMVAATELFCDNLARYLSGMPLLHVVGEAGY